MIITFIQIKYIVFCEANRGLNYVLRSLALKNEVKRNKDTRYRINKRLHKTKPEIFLKKFRNIILSWFVVETTVKLFAALFLTSLIIIGINTLGKNLLTDTKLPKKELPGFLQSPLFERVEAISILFALGFFIANIDTQGKRSNYEAWQVINSAQGQGGNGGRIKALEDLNKDEESLAGLIANNADLTEIQLQWADLARARLENTILNDSDFSNADLTKANLKDAELNNAKLIQAYLGGAELSGAELIKADLSEAELVCVKLIGANLREAKFCCADLSDTDLSGAKLVNANFSDAILCRAKLSIGETIINNTDFKNADLSGTDLSEFTLNGLNFSGAKFIGAVLKEVKLIRANLSGANLSGADLSKANLSDANFSGADLNNTKFVGAKNLLPQQVQKANNWDKAKYDESLAICLGLLQQEDDENSQST